MAVAPSETGDDARAQRLALAGTTANARAQRLALAGTTAACRLGAQEESVVLGPKLLGLLANWTHRDLPGATGRRWSDKNIRHTQQRRPEITETPPKLGGVWVYMSLGWENVWKQTKRPLIEEWIKKTWL